MRTFDFTPYYRATVGFDQLFDMLENSVAPDWPPYDIGKTGEDQYRITIAIAGFAPNEVELIQQGAALLVSGHRAEPKGQQALHRGMPNADFKLSFSLADHMKVAGASLENGLLAIDLVREVPEQMKPRRIEIGSGASVPNDQAKQIDAKAA